MTWEGWEFAPRVWATGLVFPEAPTWHDDALWVTDVAAGGVHRLTGAEGRESYLTDRKGMGGLVPSRDGDLIASGRDLVRVRDGAVVRGRPAGSTGLNDLGTTDSGDLLVGVLTFRPARGEVPSPGAVARLSRARDDWTWWEGPAWPNGIVTTSDGGTVVAEFSEGRLWRRAPDGSFGAQSPAWVPGAASPAGHLDGIAVDRAGRIWAATGPGRCVECWSPTGELIASFPVPAAFVSSVCFGGRDLATLFVTVAGYEGHAGVVLCAPAASPGCEVTPADI